MGAPTRRFAGRDFVIPGAASKRNISTLDVGSASGSNLLILAVTKKGIPFSAETDYPDPNDRVNYAVNSNELKAQIGQGSDGFDAGRFALAPSNDPGVGGAPRVGMVRVNEAVKGTGAIADVDTDDVIDVSSVGYGLYVNQIQFKISAGTDSLSKKLSTKFEGEELIKDNIDNQLLTISYTGTGADAIVQLDPVGSLVIEPAATVPDNLSLSLATYETVQSLIDAINGFRNASAAQVYTASLVGDGSFQTKYLDKVITADAEDCKTASYTV